MTLPVTVDVVTVIFSVDMDAHRLLVLVVGGEPARLPGMPLAPDLTLAEQAYQVLATKVKAEHLYLEQLYTFGGPGRDERERKSKRKKKRKKKKQKKKKKRKKNGKTEE
jgi:hypothetical protein